MSPKNILGLLLAAAAVIALAIYLARTNPVPEPHGCDDQPDSVRLECARDGSASSPAVLGVQP